MAGNEIEELVKYLARLPGLGPRSARRAVLTLMRRREALLDPLTTALAAARDAIKTCTICGNIDTQDPCAICADPRRDTSVICVVEDVGDLWALERAKALKGRYHVLGGTLSALDGMGPEGAEKIIKESGFGTRQSPSKLKSNDRKKLHDAMKNVNLNEGQSMQVLRFANRVPLQFKLRDCAITQTIMSTNWRSYGLSQSRGSLPSGPVTIMVHMASVWVPFTSESKEAIAAYQKIEKELRLGLQAVGRKLGMYMRRRRTIKQEGERRSIFLRYLGEVANAVNEISGHDSEELYNQLLKVAQRKTVEADTKLNKHGEKVNDRGYGDNVLIVSDEPVAADGTINGQGKLF